MKLKINYISIAAADLETSFTFYRDGLGLSTHGIKKEPEHHACFSLGNGLNLVLFDKKDFLGKRGHTTNRHAGSTFIISHNADSKEEVDRILQKALCAGATQVGTIKTEPWSYAAKFADPDGYEWEIVWEA
jgi:predicted lactoylglutathione lyase